MSDDKKLIDEIAKDLCDKQTGVSVVIITIDDDGNPRLAGSERYLKNLVDAGYHKPIEGAWEKRVFIIFDSEKNGYRCSECNTTWDAATNYCPNCGAKMKGELV